MSKHTPGPWKAQMQFSKNGRELGWMVEHSNGRIGWASLAYVDTNEEAQVADPVNAANARLIATAPDLLNALAPFVLANSSEEFVTIVVRSSDITKARAAIAKAIGEQT